MKQKGHIVAIALLLGAGMVVALTGPVGPTPAFADGPRLSVDANAGTGLVRSVDADTDILVLDTAEGVRRLHVAHDAAIHDEHDDLLTLRQIRPGDAVSYESKSGVASELHVTRHFEAIPEEG